MTLTVDMIREALRKDAERAQRAQEERSRRVVALNALNLDYDALSVRERLLVSLAYEGHIFHPNDHKQLMVAIARCRRDDEAPAGGGA